MIQMAKKDIDFSELTRFTEQMKKNLSKEQASELCESCAKELGARMLRKTMQKTPVGVYPPGSGKTGGTLRRNWRATPCQYIDGAYQVDVFNQTEYAPYVEYGHRTPSHNGWVEGRFMMTKSADEIEEIMPALLNKRLDEMIKRGLK